MQKPLVGSFRLAAPTTTVSAQPLPDPCRSLLLLRCQQHSFLLPARPALQTSPQQAVSAKLSSGDQTHSWELQGDQGHPELQKAESAPKAPCAARSSSCVQAASQCNIMQQRTGSPGRDEDKLTKQMARLDTTCHHAASVGFEFLRLEDNLGATLCKEVKVSCN